MAGTSTRSGTPLLTFNTKRPPDGDRGRDIVHLHLTSPPIVEAQVALWEGGERKALRPSDAADLLWSARAASHLDGRLDAWRNVPGVDMLLPGLEVLALQATNDWPSSQGELRELVFIAQSSQGNPVAAGGPIDTLDVLLKLLDETLGDLNDLVLISKYAAVGSQRPMSTIADLYRLGRTLLASDSEGPPETQQGVLAWLTAPLVVPRVFTVGLGPLGPRPPTEDSDDDTIQLPRPPRVDFASPKGLAVLARLERELDEISRPTIEAELGLGAELALARHETDMAAAHGRAASPLERPDALVRRVVSAPAARSSRVTSVSIAGASVLVNVAAANDRVTRRRRELDVHLTSFLPDGVRERVRELTSSSLEFLINWAAIFDLPEPSPSYLEPIGRSDLLLVRQTTIGYRRAEVAYIENVLVGETRERNHSSRTLSQAEFFESVESETEESTDLQTSDRAELSREVSKVVSEDIKAEGSVKITSRGPTKVVASAKVSFGHSTEESSNTAEAFARETVERASKRMLERTKRESRSLFEQEVTEENRHRFKRASTEAEHVSGIYQYLEQVSRAKIFSYGERELYDILVPEPAALIWNLAISTDVPGAEFEKPDEELFDDLTLDNLAEKRVDIIRAFRVTDLKPVPDEEETLYFSFSATGSGDNAKLATNKELRITDGYVATDAKLVVSAEHDAGHPIGGGVVVGGEVKSWAVPDGASDTVSYSFDPPLKGPELGIAINGENFQSLSGSIAVNLKRTEDHLREWALEAYGEVSRRYHQMVEEYDQNVLQAEATRQVDELTLPEGSRRRLEQMIRSELQRAAIAIMRNAPVNFDLITEPSFATQFPTVDGVALDAAEPAIRFLQHAFEWEHLSWVLYPYFWGRRDNWSRTALQTHPDPDFAAFLNAGAARLQLSVRPGFEGLVKHFMETGEVYEGDGLPAIGDVGYVAFIDEQLTSLGGPGEEVPWPVASPTEWDVISPMPLVLARRNSETRLPTWDPETGEEVD